MDCPGVRPRHAGRHQLGAGSTRRALTQPLLPPSDLPGLDVGGLDVWVGSAAVLLMLAAAGLFARRRARKADAAPSRLLRILFGGTTFAAAMTAMIALHEMTDDGLSWDLVPMTLVAVLILTLIGLVLIGIVDFWLGLLRPRRGRAWLVAAILAFGLLMLGGLALAFRLAGESEPLLQWDILQMLGITTAVALVWWSYLPAPRRNVAATFE